MNVVLSLPDDLADRLPPGGGAAERQALEAVAAEGFRAGRLSKPDLCRLPGFETSIETDEFRKRFDIDPGITADALPRQLDLLDRLGLHRGA